ncbi:organic cation transporter protein-like [Paramacrobiotus metropolitanus]|uniref:organic cation transporter protein-like n=1 Tax=Paramacrobiotus metropolitanus TaxID=2943436 RepID=UPI002445D14C|nr:organic cation transporter protein-like [Paramacrobiotus metropolitanus]XP_055332907.1 organic cation transporter protein-like [Paramacrobiotus metropolitanus]
MASTDRDAENLGKQFDDILLRIYGNGRYQKFVVALVLLPAIAAQSFLVSGFVFVIAAPPHWCKLPFERNANHSHDTHLMNATDVDFKALLPRNPEDNSTEKCQKYNVDYTELLTEWKTLDSLAAHFDNATSNGILNTTACDSWVYDHSVYHDTIVTDWDLVCHQDFLPTLAYILSAFGTVIGTPIGGYLSDLIGRKKTYLLFLANQVIFSAASAGSPYAFYGFYIFVILNIIQALSVNNTYLTPSTLGMEIITPGFRATYMVLVSVAYTVGGVASTGIAYLFRSWRTYVLVSNLPFLAYAVYWWIMPESPRWLLSRDRYDDLEAFLKRAAKMNHVDYNESLKCQFKQLCDQAKSARIKEPGVTAHQREYSYLDLFRTPQIRKQTLLMIILNTVCQICYNGLSYYAPSLGSNPYLSSFLASIVELPAALFTEIICDRIGRRPTIVLCFVLGGASCLATLGLPTEHAIYAAVLTLFLFAKLFVSSAYIVQELIQNEILPTVVRGKGVALSNFIASIATNIGPVIVYLGYKDSSLTLVVFGGIMIFASICAMFLPETLNLALPETLAECEENGKISSWKDFPFWNHIKGKL